MPSKKKGSGTRLLHTKVKTARGRKSSSTRWLQRQLNDPYVVKAKEMGFRSRAAFKLQEILEKHPFIKRHNTVLDLGAAPGGWSQISQEEVGPKGRVVGIDLLPVDPIKDVEMIEGDFTSDEDMKRVHEALGNRGIDVIISDMAPNTTGHVSTDHLRMMGLADEVLYFVKEHLKPGGHLLIKIFQGAEEQDFIKSLRSVFKKVQYMKPKASRPGSPERYVLAQDKKAD